MYQIPSTKKRVKVDTCLKYINKIFNSKLDAYDLHSIFEELNIGYGTCEFNGKAIKFYNKNEVENYLNSGVIGSKVRKIMSYRIPTKQEIKQDTIKGVPIPRFKPIEQEVEPQPEYRNHENDMEKYSEYLINNVYENKISKNMAKIRITENKLKQIINESVRRILKEQDFQEVPDSWYNEDDDIAKNYPKMDFWEYVEELGPEETLEIILQNTPPETINEWNNILFEKCHEHYQS